MESQTGIGISIGTGGLTVLSLGLVIIAFFNIYRKRMLEKEARLRQIEHGKQLEIYKAAVEAEERQKEKLARNLHDEIIPTLTAISRSIYKSVSDHEDNKFDPALVKKDLKIMHQVIEEVRGISHDLIPGMLITFGLLPALEAYVSQMSDTGGAQAEFKNKTGFTEELPLTRPDQLNVYRSCLEVLNNLYKHAVYKYLQVTADCVDNCLIIEFMHDGKGISNHEVQQLSGSPKGLGLRALKARMFFLNATINYAVEPDVSSITLKIPLK